VRLCFFEETFTATLRRPRATSPRSGLRSERRAEHKPHRDPTGFVFARLSDRWRPTRRPRRTFVTNAVVLQEKPSWSSFLRDRPSFQATTNLAKIVSVPPALVGLNLRFPEMTLEKPESERRISSFRAFAFSWPQAIKSSRALNAVTGASKKHT
jgi:hypothetical protein